MTTIRRKYRFSCDILFTMDDGSTELHSVDVLAGYLSEVTRLVTEVAFKTDFLSVTKRRFSSFELVGITRRSQVYFQ